jgi:hypothetical protein
MSHGMRQRIKKIEQNICPIKTFGDLFAMLSNHQLKAFIKLKNTRDACEISEAFGWDLEQAEIFVEDLKQVPAIKEYNRLSNEEMIEIIMGFSN